MSLARDFRLSARDFSPARYLEAIGTAPARSVNMSELLPAFRPRASMLGLIFK
jgi:hypothetical protein